MTTSRRLGDFLKDNRVVYQVVPHAKSFTAKSTATAERVSEGLVAKVVIVRAGDTHVMAVLPGSFDLDFLKLEGVLGRKDLKIEKEKRFSDIFPDCETGAMPPFGRLYGLRTLADVRLIQCPEIFIPTGDLEEGIRISMYDYLRIAQAEVVDIAAGN